MSPQTNITGVQLIFHLLIIFYLFSDWFIGRVMKLVPGPLPPLPTGAAMERLPLPLPFSPDFLWRYPIGFPPSTPTQTPTSPIIDFKTHLPKFLPTDPRLWSREDVISFLKWSEKEFDLQPFDLDMFQMNGKTLRKRKWRFINHVSYRKSLVFADA